MTRLDLRIDNKQDMSLNESGLHAQRLSNISTLNSQHNWGDLVIHIKNRHIRTLDNYIWIKQGLISNPIFADARSPDLLMHHH